MDNRQYLDVLKNDSHIIENFFFSKGPISFYGYPGSGRACAIASIIGKLDAADRIACEIVCADDWTLVKAEQLRTFSYILGCSFRNLPLDDVYTEANYRSFIYLPYDSSHSNGLLDQATTRNVLILDCSRRLDTNRNLIDQVGVTNIDGIVLTRLDTLEDSAQLIELLNKKKLSLVFFVWGNTLAIDCGFNIDKKH